MSESVFHFRKFSIYQQGNGLNVTTDAVLLGAWAGNCDGAHVLDVGCGTGILSLMAAQSGAEHVVAIDVNEDACRVAAGNISRSQWAQQIELVHASFENFFSTNTRKYDVIICNPPYFVRHLPSAKASVAVAKHTLEFQFTSFFKLAAQALAPGGRICMIVPLGLVSAECERLAVQNALYLSRFTKIFYKSNKPPERCMLEYTLMSSNSIHSELHIRNSENSYTNEYRLLTKDFYKDEAFRGIDN